MSFPIIEYKYDLPESLIATTPSEPRDSCRLMIIDKTKNEITENNFSDLADILTKNDVLVLNQSKVFPARIIGKKSTGGNVELLLFHQIEDGVWESISKPGLKVGSKLIFPQNLNGEVIERNSETGEIKIKFNQKNNEFFNTLDNIGLTPIPPYINSSAPEKTLRDQYQTVYAKNVGSAAAPTAGLHFTQELLDKLKNKGVQIEYVTLHVGLGTFKPLTQENLTSKKLHQEFYEIDPETNNRLNMAKSLGKRIIAVGTTSARALESDGTGSTQLFISPPYKFKFIDALITNFHLPESSLLMLVTALVCSPNSPHLYTNFSESILGIAYQKAIKNKYSFFSFGDAMFIH